jgi:hypothetical protein
MLNMSFGLETLTGGQNSVPVVGMHEWKEYSENGKAGKLLGYTYEILLLSSNCEKVRVRVEDCTPITTPEEIDKHNNSLNFMMVKFEGFQARPYSGNSGQMQISAKANKAILLNVNAGTGATKA